MIRSAFLAALFASLPASAALDIPTKIFENAKQGDVAAEPVSLVFPLPDKTYKSASGFTLVDDQGNAVPAQFSPLTHWRGDDVYIQHLRVDALVDLPSGGSKTYHLKEGTAAAPSQPVQVTEDATSITVSTGPLRFTVKKQGFDLFDQVSVDGKAIIASNAKNGGVLTKRDGTKLYASGNTGVTAAVEENGPVRAVIRIFATSAYKTRDDYTPGFRCRIYAYAGKPYVKVDYALRNSPHTDSKDPAGPVYFKDFSLMHALNLGASVTTTVGTPSGPAIADSVTALDDNTKAPGWIDVFDGSLGVFASIRYFWQQYPMDARYLADQKTLKLGFWPNGGRDYYYAHSDQNTRTYADVYWLDDGMQKTHQVLYQFHSAAMTQGEMAKRAALFELPPLGHVDLSVWSSLRTLPDGGYAPPTVTGTYQSRGTPAYGKNDFNGSVDRKTTNGTGGLPESGLQFIATGNPAAFIEWEPHYMMETDVRLVHMDNLLATPADSLFDLATNQYSGYDYKDPQYWDTHDSSKYLDGTGMRFGAWDTQHMWIYSFYEMYLTNGDYRIKDFYQDLGDFMSYEIAVREPFWNKLYDAVPPNNARAAGHPLGAVNLAFRVTGDEKYRRAARSWVWHAFDWFDHANGNWKHDENVPFMEGYFARALINFVQDSKPAEEIYRQKAISVISAFNDAALKWSWVPGQGYGYQHWDTATTFNDGVSVSSVVIGDPAAWLYLTTGAPRYRDSLHIYMKHYAEYFTNWSGDYTGRLSTYMDKVGLADSTPPPPISDLEVSADSKLTFTSKGGAGFVVRWSTKTIKDTYYEMFSNDTTAQMPWWSAQVSPSLAVPLAAGQKQTIDLYDVPKGTKAVVMVKTVGTDGVWSRGSNLATATITQTKSSAGDFELAVKPGLRRSGRGYLLPPRSGSPLRFYPGSARPGGKAFFRVLDLQGRQIASGEVSAPGDGGVYTWDPGGLPKRALLLEASIEGEREARIFLP